MIVKRQTSNQILLLNFDKRREFILQDFTKYLQNHRIIYQLTIVCTSQQNGMLKRKNRNIFNKVGILYNLINARPIIFFNIRYNIYIEVLQLRF